MRLFGSAWNVWFRYSCPSLGCRLVVLFTCPSFLNSKFNPVISSFFFLFPIKGAWKNIILFHTDWLCLYRSHITLREVFKPNIFTVFMLATFYQIKIFLRLKCLRWLKVSGGQWEGSSYPWSLHTVLCVFTAMSPTKIGASLLYFSSARSHAYEDIRCSFCWVKLLSWSQPDCSFFHDNRATLAI